MPARSRGYRGPVTERAVRKALKAFHLGGRRDAGGLSWRELADGYGLTEAQENERFGGPCTFFQRPKIHIV